MFIDQRKLPGRMKIVATDDWRAVARAIKTLAIRGAPLIGVSAALAVAAAAFKGDRKNARKRMATAINGLAATRPTAVNLFWALERMSAAMEAASEDDDLPEWLLNEALVIQADDRRRCEAIGRYGSGLIPGNGRVLTICNTGWLATAGEGTALAAVYRAQDDGRNPQVFVCETRPLLQGARLTCWELDQSGIPVTLMVDSAAAGAVARGMVDVAIIGADRIAANGDVINKVGSYQLALACQRHSVPFYVAAPSSTIDVKTATGSECPIELRSEEEVTCPLGKWWTVAGIKAWNPAFDMVPAELITGIITEEGLSSPPYRFRGR